MSRLRLLQLPVPPPAAMAATGNVPLAAGSLAVAIDVHGVSDLEVEVVDPSLTDNLGDELLADHIAADSPEFVGLSLYLWNVERSLYLGEAIKQRSPSTQVIIGGPEVTSVDGFVHRAAGYDIAVCGEAEDRFATLMQRLIAGADPTTIAGVAKRQADGSLGPFGSEPVIDFALQRYPSPYLTGALPVDPQRSTYVETVRGCASKCTYCFYPRSSGTLRTLDVPATVDLIRGLGSRGAREVVFLDPTFNHRPGFDEFLAALAGANPDGQMHFFGEVRAEGLHLAQAKGLAAAGFTRLEIGLQSVNKETLRKVQRFGDPQRLVEATKILQGEGIELLVDLIIGLPGDTPDDVARGVDFLLDHDLSSAAQVFPLSILPGTAMRASSEEFGLEFNPGPPYRVTRAPGFTTEQLLETLWAAEDALGRRLDDYPRPHLVDRHGTSVPDVFELDLDQGGASELPPGARHVGLWFRAVDLFARRDLLGARLDDFLARNPYTVVDVVLHPQRPFPLDLILSIREQMDRAQASYLTRANAHRGEDLQRRLVVVLPRGVSFPASWTDALLDVVPVFRDQTFSEATAAGAALGASIPGARILDSEYDAAAWADLASLGDPEVVTFASRELEAQWVGRRLRYSDRD